MASYGIALKLPPRHFMWERKGHKPYDAHFAQPWSKIMKGHMT